MSFPNPAMLPFFAAGGAISGSSFGLFYTILMQVGYNYYGKKVLAGLNEGRNLKEMLQEVQTEIQPFSDAMIQGALDSLPGIIDKSVNAFANTINSLGEEFAKDFAESWLFGKDKLPDKSGGDSVPITDALAHLAGGHFGHDVVDFNQDEGKLEPPVTDSGETVQEMFDRLKKNGAAYQEYIDTIPKDIMSQTLVLTKARDILSLGTYIKPFTYWVDQIVIRRFNLEVGHKWNAPTQKLTAIDMESHLLFISTVSEDVYSQTGYWI